MMVVPFPHFSDTFQGKSVHNGITLVNGTSWDWYKRNVQIILRNIEKCALKILGCCWIPSAWKLTGTPRIIISYAWGLNKMVTELIIIIHVGSNCENVNETHPYCLYSLFLLEDISRCNMLLLLPLCTRQYNFSKLMY